MTFKIRGPRASELLKLISEFSGLPLTVTNGEVRFSSDGVIAPFESPTLQKVVMDCIHTRNVVEIVAFGGHITIGTRMGPMNTWGDSFKGATTTSVQVPDRSLYLNDFREIAKDSPIAGRIMIGHVLKEYLGGSRPPGAGHSRIMTTFHNAAILTEAAIAHELTGRHIWSAPKKPWERSTMTTSGVVNTRSYGPQLNFEFHFDATRSLRYVKQPPGL